MHYRRRPGGHGRGIVISRLWRRGNAGATYKNTSSNCITGRHRGGVTGWRVQYPRLGVLWTVTGPVGTIQPGPLHGPGAAVPVERWICPCRTRPALCLSGTTKGGAVNNATAYRRLPTGMVDLVGYGLPTAMKAQPRPQLWQHHRAIRKSDGLRTPTTTAPTSNFGAPNPAQFRLILS